jgi:PAS domain S-box-containing protein
MTKERILIVEDETIVAMDIRQGLRRLGYEVPAMVDNGDDAIQKAKALKPDLILMDIQIQGSLDGIQTAHVIWQTLKIPVLFLTAYSDESTLQRAKAAEPFGYILKPFEERELHTSIEVALKKHRSFEEKTAVHEEALEQSEERFRLLVESVKDYAICMLSPSGTVASWNSGAERIKGYQAHEIIGRNFSLFYTPEDQQARRPQNGLEITLREGVYREEGIRVRKDGTRFWAHATLTPLRDKAGQLRGYAKVTRDITAQKQSEAQLREAVRMRDEFISIASHELKTPITSMELQIQLLMRVLQQNGLAGLEPERLHKALNLSTSQLRRLSRLVEDMLDISRIGSGKLTIEKQDCDLGQVVQEVLDRNQGQLASAQIPVQRAIEPGVTGEWDRFRIDQVVANLLSNAIKYAARNQIEVRVQKVNDRALLSVQDHGIGIAPHDQTRIFDRFERAVPVSSISGLGLGLYIAHHIVLAHGGAIRVESELQKGSTFTVELPVGDSCRQASEAESHA